MGCDLSDKEDELRLQAPSMSIGSSKRFKISKKFFYDCNGVDHASVPRRVRSAMKKRNHESVSPPLPDSKKVNRTISGVEESPINNAVKKYKLNMKHGGSYWSTEQTFSGLITKEEEEVVETLYALAGMFPDNDANEKSKLDTEYTEAKPSAFLESRESPMPMQDSAITKENSITTYPMPWISSKVTNPSSNTDKLPKETGEVDSLNEPSIQEQSGLSNSEKIHMESDSSVPQLNASSMPFLAKSDTDSEKPLRSCDLSVDTRLKLPPTQPEAPLIEKASEMALRPVNVISKSKPNGAITIASELEQKKMIKRPKKNGSALWPGLSSVLPHGVGSPGPLQSSSAAEVLGWHDAMINCRHRSFEDGSSSGEVSKVAFEKDTWKRCSTHVHISHLIQNLQMPENQGRFLLQSNQLRLQKEPNLGSLMALNSFHGLRNSFNSTISSATCNSTNERKSNEAKTGILWPQQLHHDQPHAALASEVYTPQKQGFDFLSLLTGGGGMEDKTCGNRTRNSLDSSSQFQVSYLQSLAQQQTLLPLPMPQTHYTSAAYSDQLLIASPAANQVQMRVAPFLGNSFSSPHASPAALTKQQQQQQQQHQLQQHQQQQNLWAAQLAAQYMPVATSISMTQISSWQQGRQDPSMLIPCAQASIPSPHSFLEVLGPKYASASQQKQQLMAITPSLPPARVKKQDNPFPSIYGEAEGEFHEGGMLPLQLLCNEHL